MQFPNPLPAEGLTVPLRASFTGLKGIPLIALGTNSASPLLRLYDGSLEVKVFKVARHSYEDIAIVTVFQTIGTHNLTIEWKHSGFTFTANVGDEDTLVQVLRLLETKQVTLSAKARAFLDPR